MFIASPLRLVAGVVYSLLLLAACVTDVRERRIPNVLVLALGATGLVFSLVANPILPGAARAIGGMSVGLVIWLPLWLLGKIGAGDVKLFAAAGAWLGPGNAVVAALLAAMLGGVLSLAWLVREQGVRVTVRGLWLGMLTTRAGGRAPDLLVVPAQRRVPYGLALASAAALVAWLPRLAR